MPPNARGAEQPSAIYACVRCNEPHGVQAIRCKRCLAYRTVSPIHEEAQPAAHNDRAMVIQTAGAKKRVTKISTGISEIDRVLGGGVPLGDVMLLSGAPGVGKSTFLLMLSAVFAEKGHDVAYATDEEMSEAVEERGERIVAEHPRLTIERVESMEDVRRFTRRTRPDVVMFDSISEMAKSMKHLDDIASEVKQLAAKLNAAFLVIAHVTKEEQIAGTMALQHLFGATFFLSECMGMVAMRGIKNRFGPKTTGYFEMTAKGLHPVTNPSERFLADRLAGRPGSVVAACIDSDEKGRAKLVEVQAVVGPPKLKGGPRLMLTGASKPRLEQRLHVINAAISRAAGEPALLMVRDISVNVPGEIDATEPAMDLPVALAIASAVLGEPSREIVSFGEIGLVGEVRSAEQTSSRIEEAAAMEFEAMLAPRRTEETAAKTGAAIEVLEVESLDDAIAASFPSIDLGRKKPSKKTALLADPVATKTKKTASKKKAEKKTKTASPSRRKR